MARLRLLHALHLWRDHLPGCRFLLTGGPAPGTATTEARAMARWSLEWAETNWGPEVREELAACLLLEEASLNTAASAANTLPLVQGLERQGGGPGERPPPYPPGSLSLPAPF